MFWGHRRRLGHGVDMNSGISKLLGVASLALLATPSHAVTYSITDLGITFYSGALSNNRFGVTAFLDASNNVYYEQSTVAYKYSNGTITKLGSGQLTGINDQGDYVQDGIVHNVPGHSYPPTGYLAEAINNNHGVAFNDGRSAQYATLYRNSPNGYYTYALPGSSYSELETINNHGTGAGLTYDSSGAVSGAFTSHFVPGDITRSGPFNADTQNATQVVQYAVPTAATLRSVVGVSNADMIAGTLQVAATGYGGALNYTITDQAYVTANGMLTSIGALGGSTFNANGRSEAYGLNDAGQVVGTSTYGGFLLNRVPIAQDNTHGFIYQNGALTDLNSLLGINDASRYTIVSALRINNAGTVLVTLGDGALGLGERLGLLTLNSVSDVPEPTSWATMIVGFGAVGVGMRRRRKVADRPAAAL